SAFTFGESQPYWLDYGGIDGFRAVGPVGAVGGSNFGPQGPGVSGWCYPQPEQKAAPATRRTAPSGNHYLQLKLDGEEPERATMVAANAAVTDVNRQSFASNLELLVHPASLYVGIRSTRQYVREGEPFDVDVIVTDIDGHAVPGRKFTITASRVESRFENGTWVDTDVDPQHCDATSSTKPVSCSIKAGIGGQSKISAVVVDDAGGHNRSEFTRWVSGADTVPTRDVQQESATVVPDHDTYRPGDTAHLLVIAPFASGRGLLTVSANHSAQTHPFA